MRWPIFLITGFLVTGLIVYFWPEPDTFVGTKKSVTVDDNGLTFSFRDVSEDTVGEFLRTRHLALREKESVFPGEEARLSTGMTLFITRTHEISVQADGTKKAYAVLATSVGEALAEAGVTLDEDDIVKPAREAMANRGTEIIVTRVDIREEVVEKALPFEKKTNEDDTLSWRKTVVTQKGEKGMDHLVYRVSSHDGKEVNRKLIRTERVKDPVPEIVTQGTYVKLGKSHSGAASWYAWTGTMAAANPWLPKGSYVKVTNMENGKSVIVVINDRGPFVPGRIIDLDKVAFAKIASVGAGVINVKMEEITN
jgi:uncharacterized protein YabE (DUF348 family)